MGEGLEREVKRGSGFGKVAKKVGGLALWTALTFGAGTYTGMRHEKDNHTLQDKEMVGQIGDYAVQGGAWKEGADPTFYDYRLGLVIDSSDMTMQGHLYKVAGQDTIDAGPIWKGGRVGYPLTDRLEKGFEEETSKWRKGFDEFKEKVGEGYDQAKEYVQDKKPEWFRKEPSKDTVYQHGPVPQD